MLLAFELLTLFLLIHLQVQEFLNLRVSLAFLLFSQVLLLVHRHNVSYHVVMLASVLIGESLRAHSKAFKCLLLDVLLPGVRHHFLVLSFKVLARAHIGQSLETRLLQVIC